MDADVLMAGLEGFHGAHDAVDEGDLGDGDVISICYRAVFFGFQVSSRCQ